MNYNQLKEQALNLVGKTLREVLHSNELSQIATGNKGKFGQNIENHYFGITNNSRSGADFEELGIELKVTPLKYLKNGSLTSKERMVCNVINYMDIVEENWENSTFLKKNKDILIIRYIDPQDKSINQLDYKIDSIEFFSLNEDNPYYQGIKKDWITIQNKIKNGEAHLLSEKDTTYLGACTKGSTAAKSFRKQPNSQELAKQRAFCFKSTFAKELYFKKQ